MFESAPVNPPDSIFGLMEEFRNDSNPEKINLTVGMYQDDSGKTPVMECVRDAKSRIHEAGKSHVYLPIDGLGNFNDLIPGLIFGESHVVLNDHRAYSAQTPGGTSALRVAGEMLRAKFNVKTIWVSQPTWANHLNIFPAAGLNLQHYHYLDETGTAFDLEGCLESISNAENGDAILLHTVCHNPTGVDPTTDQWKQIFAAIETKRMVPIFDFAYQGFGESVPQDSWPIRTYCDGNADALVCSSFSKNFNLYGERVGAITVVGPNSDDAKAVLSQCKAVIRTIYSNPPTFGAAIVDTVFRDNELKEIWLKELETIRLRICELRKQFVAEMKKRLPDMSFDHILHQRGMFSYSGIQGEAADRLKVEHSVYLLRSGRINIAGMNATNLERLCDAIASVMTVKS